MLRNVRKVAHFPDQGMLALVAGVRTGPGVLPCIVCGTRCCAATAPTRGCCTTGHACNSNRTTNLCEFQPLVASERKAWRAVVISQCAAGSHGSSREVFDFVTPQ